MIKSIMQSKLSLASFLILIAYMVIAALAGFGVIATDYGLVDNFNTYAPPSSEHLLGTDFLGRDVLARAIQGARLALLIGFFSASIATVIGFTMGMIGGYFGKWVDDLVVWVFTTIDSIPYILLVSAFSFVLGPGLINLYIALGLTGWVNLCRLVRAEVLKQKNLEYMSAAEAIGSSHFNRLFRHLSPNVLHLILIQFSLTFLGAIKVEVLLSYLGLGVEQGTPSWGFMISDAQIEFSRGVWWGLASASGMMFFLILSVNLLTDHLRKYFDPKST